LYYTIADKSRAKWGASSEYLFLQKDIYDYKLDYEMTIIGYYANDDNYDLNKINMKVMSNPHIDNGMSKNVLNNYKFYSKKIIEQHTLLSKKNMDILLKATTSLNITESGEYVSSTPSIVMRGNHLIVNVRYVNYRIDEHGNYVNQDKIRTKNAIAIIDVSNPKLWKNVQEFELKYDESIDNHYVGLEDIRIFNDNYIIYYNSNRGLSYGNMEIEHGIIDLSKESTAEQKCLKKVNQHTIEKNWVLIPSNNIIKTHLKTIYHWSPNLIIGDIVEDQFVETHQIKTPAFFKYLRGSTNGVIINDEIWLICHAVSYEDRRYYYHIVIVLDKDTYNLKKYTPFFTFEGEKVEYTLGFIYLENDDSLMIGYSIYDKNTKYMNIKRDYFENMMILHE
jgi:hypothetical protein